MDESGVRELARRLGSSPPKSSGSNWMMISCVLKHNHGGKDKTPSMGVLLDSGKSVVRCHACDYSGTLQAALFEAAKYEPSLLALAFWVQGLESRVTAGPLKITGGGTTLTDYTIGWQDLVESTSEYSELAIKLLTEKGVSIKTAKAVGLVECGRNHTDDYMGELETGETRVMPYPSLVFPYLIHTLDAGLKCVGAGCRPLVDGAPYKYTTLYKFEKRRFLYMEQILTKIKDKALFLVEGYFDVLHLLQEGLPCVGLIGVYLSDQQAKKIASAGPRIVHIMLDPDQYGNNGAEKAQKKLAKLGVKSIIHRLEKDPKYYSKQDILSVIDTSDNDKSLK